MAFQLKTPKRYRLNQIFVLGDCLIQGGVLKSHAKQARFLAIGPLHQWH